jgi:hypothetical protein
LSPSDTFSAWARAASASARRLAQGSEFARRLLGFRSLGQAMSQLRQRLFGGLQFALQLRSLLALAGQFRFEACGSCPLGLQQTRKCRRGGIHG